MALCIFCLDIGVREVFINVMYLFLYWYYLQDILEDTGAALLVHLSEAINSLTSRTDNPPSEAVSAPDTRRALAPSLTTFTRTVSPSNSGLRLDVKGAQSGSRSTSPLPPKSGTGMSTCDFQKKHGRLPKGKKKTCDL